MALVAVTATCASDLLKSALLPAAQRLRATGQLATAWGCILLMALAMTFSGTMALSGALGSRIEASSGRAAVESDRTRLTATNEGARATQGGLPPTRSVAELESLIATGSGVDPVTWVRTAKCADVTRPASQLACRRLADLSAEFGRARHRVEVEAVIAGGEAALGKLPAPRVADATVTAAQRVAALFGLTISEETVQVAAALVLVALLELGSVLAWSVADAMSAGHKERAGRLLPVNAPQAALEPQKPVSSPMAAQEPPAAQLQPVGRQRTTAELQQGFAALMQVLERVGGTFTGSKAELSRLMGCSRSAAQRLLNAAAAQKLVALATVPGHSTTVRLLGEDGGRIVGRRTADVKGAKRTSVE